MLFRSKKTATAPAQKKGAAKKKTAAGKAIIRTVAATGRSKAKASIELPDIPEPIVEVMNKNGLRIKLEKISKQVMFDQGEGMVAADGCVSNPGGPGC